MSALSDYLEDEMLDHILSVGSYTMPTNVYVGLSLASFNDDNSGTEITGNNYARVVASFGVAASGTSSNDAAIEFAAATGTWGSVSHFGIFDVGDRKSGVEGERVEQDGGREIEHQK